MNIPFDRRRFDQPQIEVNPKTAGAPINPFSAVRGTLRAGGRGFTETAWHHVYGEDAALYAVRLAEHAYPPVHPGSRRGVLSISLRHRRIFRRGSREAISPVGFLITAHAAFTPSFTTGSRATCTSGNRTAPLELLHVRQHGCRLRRQLVRERRARALHELHGCAQGLAISHGRRRNVERRHRRPKTTLNLESGGTFNGTVMMKSCTLLGGVSFHYDRSRGSLGSGVAAARWKEVESADERAPYSAPLNFRARPVSTGTREVCSAADRTC